jgi:hypothetical protein
MQVIASLLCVYGCMTGVYHREAALLPIFLATAIWIGDSSSKSPIK